MKEGAEEVEMQKAENETLSEKKKLEEENDKVDETIINIELSLKVADDIVEAGNNQFKELLTKKNLTRKELLLVQFKIEIDTKRRKELLKSQAVLMKLKRKLSQ